jgi:hypothetical protein
MVPAPRRRVWLARTLPGALLVATIVDDPLFGGSIVAARLASGDVRTDHGVHRVRAALDRHGRCDGVVPPRRTDPALLEEPPPGSHRCERAASVGS